MWLSRCRCRRWCYELSTAFDSKEGVRDKGTQYIQHRRIDSQQEGNELIAKAAQSRTTASTALNHSSSRSHCIVRVSVTFGDHLDTAPVYLSFVDLAGSERVKESRVKGQQFKVRDLTLAQTSGSQCHMPMPCLPAGEIAAYTGSLRGKSESHSSHVSAPKPGQEEGPCALSGQPGECSWLYILR